MMDVSSDLARTFHALCELRSFSKAAKKLYKSQSAVSSQIAALEKRVGLKFFDRSERPLRLTEPGQMFLNFSSEFLNKLEELDRFLSELASGVVGEVKIAASSTVGTYLLPSFLVEILRNSPKLKITMSVQGRHAASAGVRRADQDFGVILADKPPEGLIGKPLKKIPLCFVVSAKHTLANTKTISPKKLQSTPFVAGFKGSDWDTMVDRMLSANGIRDVFVALRINNYQATKEAVLAGLGVVVASQLTVQRELCEKTLCQLHVRNVHLDATIMLIERPRHVATPAVTAVKTFLKERISALTLDSMP